MKKISFLLLGCMFILSAKAQVPSPADFLGYETGERFTHHHEVVSYFKAVAESSSQVELMEYGKTKEGRPLILAFISSEQNIQNLERIREDNLRRARLMEGTPSTKAGVVWMSYNVHGNEASATEAAIKTLHQLLTDADFSKYLDNTVVIIDPCLNPDGRDRYVHFFEQWQNSTYNVVLDAAEHREPWPGGRPNHYLFDLNRDWAWQTQTESQQRMKVYNRWMPQIHVDFHEQGINSPYYFAPAAAPFHALISKWQRKLQLDIGKNHAKYFDENGWLYFTREVFDLLYPSYGDTYPTFNGAIGMTYEQAGHGTSGLGVRIADGQILMLKDRTAHHTVTGLSTVEVASQQNAKLLSEFSAYFEKSIKGEGLKYKSFVVKNNNQDRINHLMGWLDKMGIRYGKVASSRSMKGFHYQSRRNTSYTVNSSDLVIPGNQPRGVLAQVLFEPKTFVEDSLTYDITAWSAPYFYGLDAYANESNISNVNQAQQVTASSEEVSAPYALIAKYNSLKDGEFLAALLQENLKVRVLTTTTEIDGKSFQPGSIVVTQTANKAGYERTVYRLAKELGREVASVSTGFANYGKDLGSSAVELLKKPKVGLVGGEGTSSLVFGQVRYYFEQEIKYPCTVLRTDYISSINLDKYDVLIFPSGGINSSGKGFEDKLTSWVKAGGKLILMDGALSTFKNVDNTSLSTYFDDNERKAMSDGPMTKAEALATNAEKNRNWLDDAIPGAIYEVTVDPSNKMSYGLEGNYFTLKTSGQRFAYLKGGSNVGTIRSRGALVAGFVGEKRQEKLAETLVFGTENMGRGTMVYLVDNPLFRSFWYEGKILFTNAVFLAD